MPRRRPPDPWPWPADSPLDRARRATTFVLDALREVDPAAADRAQQLLVALGETWILGAPALDDDELLDAAAAAEHCHIRPATLDRWAQRGLRVVRTPDGNRYRVGDLHAYQAALRKR